MSFAQIGSLGSKGPSVTAAPIAPVTVARGGSASFEIDFRVAPGFHINSNQPKGEYLLPTALKLDPPSDVVIAKISYPPGQDYSFSFAPDEKLNVYSGDFKIRGTVKTTSTVPAGTYRVHGTLNYQACDNTACYPPKKLAVAFDIHVQKTAARAHRRNPGQSPNSK
ncbi:MAG TPA: protein-disulfide reductase DsbD domain-containing protein [Terriglobales bacterium]|nr:protein-disulfide reductase DsbD domain-containing protein [Terriglobales bacterium]